jgi:transglutaminase-like putative cysteine protease
MIPQTQRSFIPRKPLLMLAVAMAFTVPAMFGNLVWWVPSAFLATLLLRLLMETRGARLRSATIKVLLMAGGVGAIAISYHSIFGPEPGLSICLAFIAVKILEAHTVRDFHVLAALGWFASLAQVLIVQTLTISVVSGIAFAIVLAAVLLFHRPSASLGALLREGGMMLLQALPLVVVLFFLFPRGSGGLGFIMRGAFVGQSGMSDTLSPGSVAGMTLSNRVAFRAVFPDGTVPSDLYWRGAILTKAEGMTWRASKIDLRQQYPEPTMGKAIRQRIVLQPHGNRWLFALASPQQAPRGAILTGGNVLLAKEDVHSTLQYEVLSYPIPLQTELSPFQARSSLQLNDIGPATRSLAQSWSQSSDSPQTIVQKAIEFFQKGNFRYTLSPGQYAKNGLDEFLFQRRAGFCEHYAAAFATLMRAAGVPARVVIGYQGGEYNAIGSYVIVRQSNAHAWCEVWLPDTGWHRVDPTAAVGRMAPGAAGVDAAAAANPIARALRTRGFLHSLLLAWDSINYEWDTHVVGFDEDTQQSTLLENGLTNTKPLELLGWILAIASTLLGIQFLFSWLKARPRRDPLVHLYEQFCRRAATLGAPREPWEGPIEFAQRAALIIPSQSESIQRIVNLYTQLRYSASSGKDSHAQLAQAIKGFCHAKIRKAG